MVLSNPSVGIESINAGELAIDAPCFFSKFEIISTTSFPKSTEPLSVKILNGRTATDGLFFSGFKSGPEAETETEETITITIAMKYRNI
ncbi:MAG: hypothetical protein JRF40_01845 [Deltaproteobacteria bacterium]|nr:hypothetical protein [Deltaproteobacteria bacterium]